MNAHRAIDNRLRWMERDHPIGLEDAVLQKTPVTFDVSIYELFWPLRNGARLVLARPGGHREPAYLADRLAAARITAVHFVPSMLRAFLDEPRAADACSDVRWIFASGEALTPELVRGVGERLRRPLHNLYGPTEAAVEVSAHLCQPADAERAAIPIGRPISAVRLHLLEPGLAPAPIGVPGELHIGGVAVARGYRGRPALTAERFVPDPCAPEPGERLYRSGDRARHLAGGAIEFLGRLDHQIKLRGLRVEPGEIETVLAEHPEVARAVVVLRQDGATLDDARLVAYVVPEPSAELATEALREHVTRGLPSYMVPSAFVVLGELPLLPSGKLNRKALPAPRLELDTKGSHEAPRGPLETALAALWRGLLGVNEVGRGDDFFALGGHSLSATRLISRVRGAFGVEVPLREIFAAPTLEKLAQRIETLRKEVLRDRLDDTLPTPSIPPIEQRLGDGDAPASYAQERLWLLDQLDPGQVLYNMPGALRLSGELRPAALAAALTAVVRRHEVLRTVFTARGGTPTQQILEVADPLVLPLVDLSRLDRPEPVASRLLGHAARRPFSLARGPLLSALLVRRAERDHVLFVNQHHIVSDNWSVGLALAELTRLYAAAAGADGLEGMLLRVASPLAPLPIQYADFAAWQRQYLNADALAPALEAWHSRLAGVSTELELPTDRPRPALPRHLGAVAPCAIGSQLHGALGELARAQGMTLYMVLLAAFQTLLHRMSGQDDVVVGTPIAGRDREEIEGLLGFFVNTLPMVARFPAQRRVGEHLTAVRDDVLAAYLRQQVPFEMLVDALAPERRLAVSPLVQVIFALQNAPLEPRPVPGLEIERLEVTTGTAKFDFTLALEETPEGLVGWLEYSTELFDPATAERLLDLYRTLLDGFAAASSKDRLADLEWLEPSARAEVLVAANELPTPYPRDASIPELFMAQAARTPDATALVDGAAVLSYGELERRSALVAQNLVRRGVRRGTPVGVASERSAAFVIASLAILRAGGAYVPLDPSYPEERRALMREDAGIEILADDIDQAPPDSRVLGGTFPPPDLSAEDLAYVVYTSGSTGRPKGIEVPHRGVVRLVLGTDYVTLGPGRRVAHVSSTAFDAATFELWGALLTGATLEVLRPDTVLSPSDFLRALSERRVTHLFLTTALFNALIRQRPDGFAPLTAVLFGGEAVNPRRVHEALAAGPPQRLLHVYGPTENTTFSTWQEVAAGSVGAADRSVSIGRSLANSTSYVTDGRLQLQPLCVPGELVVGGDGLARGYLQRPARSAAVFVPDPFATAPSSTRLGARLYRTGDRVRQLPGGAIEFLGRWDHQIKLRGFRIELGEIDSALLALSEVRTALTLVRRPEAGEAQLVAYIAPRTGGARDLDTTALRTVLRTSLPAHMVPTFVVALDELPLNANGKIDRAALDRLPMPTAAPTASGAPPASALEKTLATAWREVLGIERVGREDNFFDIGGTSIGLAQVAERLRGELDEAVPIADLYRFPTVRSLAEHLGDGGDAARRAENEALGAEAERQAAKRRAMRGRRRRR